MRAAPDPISTIVRAFRAGDQIVDHAAANAARWHHAIRETDDLAMPCDTIAMSLQPCTFYRKRGGRLEQGPGGLDGVGLLPKGSYGTWHYHTIEHRVLHVYLHPAELAAVSEARFDARNSELRDDLGVEDPILQAMMQGINTALDSAAPGQLYLDTMTAAISAHVLRHHCNMISPRPASGGMAPWQVARIRDYLASHLADNVSLAELAALVGMSPYHFCRAFRRSVGAPPHRYQIKLRVERAKNLLANSPLSIADISASVGYEDQGQLARLFRTEVGMSPSHYRRERRR
jgi:AraC family transcriptional regulator